MNGSEPSDSIRVVNAVLTQLDQLKNCDNVLILTTSNITQAIDIAFVDRADIKQYVGPPSTRGRYAILRSCIAELMRVGIVTAEGVSSSSSSSSELQNNQWQQTIPEWSDQKASTNAMALHLKRVSDKCDGLSGRALRKLPFLAHAYFVKTPQCSLETYMNALEQAVSKESDIRKRLEQETMQQ